MRNETSVLYARSPGFSFLRRPLGLLVVALVFAGGLIGCQSEEDGGGEFDVPPVIDVTAVDYAFVAPDTIPSGWVTFRMANEGEETHYFALNRLPEGRTFAEFRRTVVGPADSLRRLLAAGEIDTTEFSRAAQRIIPDWVEGWSERVTMDGGVPSLAPGRTTRTTVEVEPGTYVMGCRLLSPNGRTHAAQGMIRGVTVAEDSSGGEPPEPDVIMRASDHEVTTDGSMRAGRQTVALRVEESSAEREDFYWSAELARIESDTDAEELHQEFSMQNPQPVEFLGGLEAVVSGKTAYTELDLESGRYMWSLHGQRDTAWTFTIR